MEFVDRERIATWNRAWALAVVFGVASIPWTYGFVAGLEIPLWPSFVASATYFAVEESGVVGLVRALASNLAGIAYAAATLFVVAAIFGGDPIALSVLVGVGMFLASLHAFVDPLSFTPGTFLGYATLFSVDAAGASALGLDGLAGATVAAAAAMAIGAAIGLGTELVSEALADEHATATSPSE
jgi:hypothetical protein